MLSPPSRGRGLKSEGRRRILRLVESPPSRGRGLKFQCDTLLKFAWEDPLAYRIIWESMFADKKLFKEYYETFSHDYVRQLGFAVKVGEVRDDVDLETLSYILMGISNFVGLQVLFRDQMSDQDFEDLAENVMKILSSGMFNK